MRPIAQYHICLISNAIKRMIFHVIRKHTFNRFSVFFKIFNINCKCKIWQCAKKKQNSFEWEAKSS